MTNDQLDENQIYKEMKEENTIDVLKKEFKEFISNNKSSEEHFQLK